MSRGSDPDQGDPTGGAADAPLADSEGGPRARSAGARTAPSGSLGAALSELARPDPAGAASTAAVDELLAAAVRALGGQHRPGQVQMAHAVAAAMARRRHLLVQAGTGTGKSLAYLIPALLHATAEPPATETGTKATTAMATDAQTPASSDVATTSTANGARSTLAAEIDANVSAAVGGSSEVSAPGKGSALRKSPDTSGTRARAASADSPESGGNGRRRGPVIVATATLALQHQLVERDLPRLVNAVADLLPRRPTFAVLKGRSNYVCLERLHRTEDSEPDSEPLFSQPSSFLGRQAAALRRWAESTSLGDRDEYPGALDPRVWRGISVSSRECIGRARCPYGQDCYAERAREAARDADVVVTNHAMLAIGVLEGIPVLPPHDSVIIDEAHELVDRATSAVTLELSARSVERAITRSRRLLEPDVVDLLADAAEQLAQALTRTAQGVPGVAGAELRSAQGVAWQPSTWRGVAVEAVAGGVAAGQVVGGAGVRGMGVAGQGIADQGTADQGTADQRTADQGTAGEGAPRSVSGYVPITELGRDLTLALAGVRDACHAAGTALAAERGDPGDPQALSQRQQARAALEEAHDVAGRLLALTEHDVAWLDVAEGRPPVLRIAPLSVAGLLRTALFQAATVIMTSATLTLGGSFDAMAGNVGLTGDSAPPWDGVDAGSPFDFARQGILYAAARLPAPNRAGTSQASLAELADLIEAAGGRTLALFSSWRAVERAADYLRDRLDIGRLPLLVQQRGDAIADLVQRFAADPATTLLGTMSLWQGVDVPGAACNCVVIDRIPFPRPDDPIVAARQRAVDADGGSGFRSVSVPRAALLLAQGVGRLIRGRDDRGVVAVLDSRLATAAYGTFLRNSLPPFWYTTDGTVVRAALRRLDVSAAPPPAT